MESRTVVNFRSWGNLDLPIHTRPELNSFLNLFLKDLGDRLRVLIYLVSI